MKLLTLSLLIVVLASCAGKHDRARIDLASGAPVTKPQPTRLSMSVDEIRLWSPPTVVLSLRNGTQSPMAVSRFGLMAACANGLGIQGGSHNAFARTPKDKATLISPGPLDTDLIRLAPGAARAVQISLDLWEPTSTLLDAAGAQVDCSLNTTQDVLGPDGRFHQQDLSWSGSARLVR
jgi:hypothetical protein